MSFCLTGLHGVLAGHRYVDENLGSALQRIQGFDQVTGLPDYIQTGPGGNPTVQNLAYAWDGVGNVTERRDDTQGITEAFAFDNLHRLTSASRNGINSLSVGYDGLGNITSKTGQGTYTYHTTRKHAVVSTSGGGSYAYDGNGNMTSRNSGTVTWYSYNLPNTITSGSSSSQFFYAPDGARYKQIASYSGTTETTLYVGGLLEKMTRSGVTEYRHAILAGGAHTVIYTRRSDGTNSTYHVTRDHLGSSSAVTDAAGNLLINESFDAFGERRGSNWTGTPSAGDLAQIAAIERRGFTDHEHLDNLNLIHMNGRVYDPGLGRFIQADPFIDGWGNTQGYNRYSYVKNRPLRFVDPSGFDDEEPLVVRTECESAACGGSSSLSFSSSDGIPTRPDPTCGPNCFTPVYLLEFRLAVAYARLENRDSVPGTSDGTMGADSPAAVETGLGPVSDAAVAAGLLASSAEHGSGRTTVGTNLRIYFRGFYGNQSVPTFRLVRIGAAGSVAFFAVGSIYDNVRIANREISRLEGFGNMSANILGLAGGPWGLAGAGSYYGLQYFYPGGASGFAVDATMSLGTSQYYVPIP